MLDPGLDERHGGALGLEPGVELFHERRGQRHVGVGERGQQLDQLLGFALGGLEHAVRPEDRRIAFLATTGYAYRDATKILEQRQLQHDRKCPQLAQEQGMGSLVGSDELGAVVATDTSIRVRDQLQREIVNARETRRHAIGEPRQLTAIAAWQMPPRHSDLLLDQVEIVEQPSLGRYRPLSRRRRRCDNIVRCQQDLFIVIQPRQQPVGARTRINPVLARQRHGVTLQLLDAEQLRTQQFGVVVAHPRTARA